MAWHDITGQRFGNLVAVRFLERAEKKSLWLCVCDCGTERAFNLVSLTRTQHPRQSCGCILAEKNKARAKHGLSQSAEYRIWQKMRERCTNKNKRDWKYYGGRGISVCERWIEFENFYTDMGPRPSEKHEIDRFPNNNGNYEPGNCRWATHREQLNNYSRNRLITIDGETLNIKQWSERSTVTPLTIWKRLNRGWTPRDAVLRGKSHRFRRAELLTT